MSKNDFWRLRSQADGLSGPRVAGCVGITVEGLTGADFTARQTLRNGETTCFLTGEDRNITAKSWVSATEDLVFIELSAGTGEARVKVDLTAPANDRAVLRSGKSGSVYWLSRAFEDSVDIKTKVAISLKIFDADTARSILIPPKGKVTIAIAVESRFKKEDPVDYVV
ncbi:MAG TPA: hypothetical protein VGS79_01040, partial [Puia sp.]|nr:hypothetical protein [Puia sp.]